MKVAKFLKNIFILALVMESGEIFAMTGSSSASPRQSSSEQRHIAEKDVEIRATVPSIIGITILQGEQGIELFDDTGRMAGTNERTIKFQVTGTFQNAKLSFSGINGLAPRTDNIGTYWTINNDTNNQLAIEMFLKDNEPVREDDRSIVQDNEYEVQRNDIKNVQVNPMNDAWNARDGLALGVYKGTLHIHVQAID